MSIEIQSLQAQDIPWAMELVREAGWNQLPDDWSRLLNYAPGGCFKAMLDERAVGTLTTTRYGQRLAWIGMMLVQLEFRRRGVAKALMRHAIDYLRTAGTRTIKLDATPAGRPLYEQLGFCVEWEFQRWQVELPPCMELTVNSTTPQPMTEAALALDRRAFGVDRTGWLQHLCIGSRVVATPQGFGMCRQGRIANYLGPIVAVDIASAEQIARELLSQLEGNCLWDPPGPDRAAAWLAEQLAFQPVRTFYRMRLGEPLPVPWRNCQFAIADPATG